MVAPPLRIVGQPLGRIEGEGKVTGGARYAADVLLPGQLWGKCLRSPHPHARIVAIDVSAARRVPGVMAVITAADLPHVLVGHSMRDLPLLAREQVRFVGERVAAVAAVDADTAEEALSLIHVEYEELPAVLDAEAAMDPDAPVIHPELESYPRSREVKLHTNPNVHAHFEHRRGDVARGMAEADVVVEHRFRTALMHQGYIEPHACVVSAEPGGTVQVWMSNKSPFRARDHLAEALDLPPEAVVLHHVPIGGDFGGKGSLMNAPLAYFLSRASGQPVAMVLSYAEELTAAQPRHPSVIYLKTGVKRDGTLVAREGRAIFNRGAYSAFNPSPNGMLGGVYKLGGSYRIPNAHIEGFCVYTNQVPCGNMRAPGQPQVIFAVEAHMDLVAAELGIDPLEFRLKNVLVEGDEPIVGVHWQGLQAKPVLERAAEAVGWGTPKPPYVGRGLALSERGVGGGESHVEVELRDDGRVFVHTGAPDTGAGVYTILRQVVAEAMGLDPEAVDVGASDTGRAPFDPGAGGSKTTHITGQAAVEGARQLRARIAERAAAQLGCQPEEVTLADGAARVNGRAIDLASLARQAQAEGEPLRARGEYDGRRPEIVSFVAQAAEVEVDPETGQVRVRRIASAHDVGTILNPLGHQGQIDGGVMQGVGSALMEEEPLEDGRVVTANLGEYRLPTTMDMPELVTVHVQEQGGPAPFGGKSIGEEPFVPTAGAIVNAVRDATGVPIYELPISPAVVLEGLQARRREKPRGEG
jgi:CO/xanthine dehydrogenase Mo-binding subunit